MEPKIILSPYLLSLFQAHCVKIPKDPHLLETIQECEKYRGFRTMIVTPFQWDAWQKAGWVFARQEAGYVLDNGATLGASIEVFIPEINHYGYWSQITLSERDRILIISDHIPEADDNGTTPEFRFWQKLAKHDASRSLVEILIWLGLGEGNLEVQDEIMTIMYG
jgi:hypothetical protein